jgi:hypothetical protein
VPANIITSGDYSLGLNSGNAFVVTGLISSTGNIAGAYILGNGSLLSGVANASSSYQITNGTSNIVISAAAANITMAVANAAGNVITVTNTGMFVTGDLTVSGNATLSGNISGDHIDNGTTAIDISAPNGNANITVGGVSNIAVFATTGVYVTGLISATSNVIANNVMATNIVNVASHTGSVVSVTANVTGGNLVTGGLITATSNIQGGNILTAGLVSSTSNIQGGNLLTGGLISSTGTVTGSSLLGSVVSVTANITGGNVLTGGLISATGNITGGNINTATVRNSSAALTLSTGSGNINLNPTGNVVLNSTYINGLSQPVQDNDAASKIYVDNAVSTALTYHSPVAAATTTTLATATSGTITYTQPNGAGNGVGATLTTTGTFLLIDTANIQTVGTRVLVKDEGNAVFNGVYTYANTTAIVRATDADQYGSDSTEALSLNDYFFVTGGTTNAGAAFVVSAPTGTITFGTSNIVFSQFSSSQTYSANTSAGISISGTVINAKTDNSTTAFDGGGNIIVKTSAQLVTPDIGVATGTSLSATGNVQGGNLFTAGSISSTGTITSAANIVSSQFFIGNGSQLSGLFVAGSTGGAIVSGTSNVRVALDANTTVGVAGTTVGTFASTGLYIPGLISAAGNVTGDYFIGNGSQLTGLSASKIYNGTSEANIGASSGNANITIGGTSNVVVVSTAGMYVTGLSSTTGNVISGNVTTAGLITATGNITGGNLLTAGLASVTGNILGGNILTGALVSASTVVAAGNVTGGNILTGGLISATSSITAAANITGGNILTAGLVSATANITGGNLLTAGLVSATGNVTGSYILGNGACLSGVITSVANINNGTSNVTVVSSGGNISVSVGGTSNVAVWATTGEYVTGLISASGNVTGGNLLTGGLISASGNGLVAGSMAIGTTPQTAVKLNVAGLITGSLNGYGTLIQPTVQPDVTTGVYLSRTQMATAANGGTPYTISNAYGYFAHQGTFNADSTVTTQAGFAVSASFIGATNNRGFVGDIANGTGRYNLYMSGTADNYLAGTLGIGTTTLGGGYALRVTKTFSADNGSGVFSTAIGSSSTPTGLFSMRSSVSTATNSGTPYTIGAVYSYYAVQGTFDADSTVTTQHGYYVGSSLTGATNNYAFTGSLASGTGRYNLYMSGTANNYLAGNVGIANTAPTTALGVTGAGYFSGNITGGNLLTGGLISATGNVNVGNLLNAGLSSVTGNITGGNILTGGLISATSTITSAANITGGNILTGGLISATSTITSAANITGGNLVTGGLISATSTITSAANITGGNILTGGLISATGTVTGSSLLGSVVSVSGNVTGGNLLTGGLISATSTITSAANITGGNLLTAGLISATSSITGGTGLFGTTTNAVYDSVGVARAGVFAASNTSTTINSSTAALAIVNNDTTTDNWAQLNFAAVTGASTNQYSSGIIAVQFGARTNAQYPTGTMTFSTSSSLNAAPSEKMRITSAGTLNVNVANIATAIDNAAANGVGNIGSSTSYFNTVFAKATSAQYADLAEAYAADAEYEPGTVVVFGGTHEITISTTNADTAVAGVISTNPSYLMNSGLEAEHRAIVALTGRVPTRVLGPVTKGAMMVTAGNGYAQACATPTIGTVIGKSLENFNGDSGVIEIVVGRV